MKTHRTLFTYILFLVFSKNLNAQCPGGGSPYSSINFSLTNNTSCEFYYAVEAGTSSCTNCGGTTGVIGPSTTISVTIYNCSSPGVGCSYLNWALAYPTGTGTVIQSSEDFNQANCSGTDLRGQGSGCCTDDWEIVIVNNSLIEINY